jgi:hypothetical protein
MDPATESDCNYLEDVIGGSPAVCLGDVLAKLSILTDTDGPLGGNAASLADTRAFGTVLEYLWSAAGYVKRNGSSPAALWVEIEQKRKAVAERLADGATDEAVAPMCDEQSAMEERLAREPACDLGDVVAKLEFLADPTIGIAAGSGELLEDAAETALGFLKHFAAMNHPDGLGFSEPVATRYRDRPDDGEDI